MTSKVLLLFVTIYSVVDLGTGLRCYECLASTTSDCYDGVISSYINQDCQEQSFKNFSLLSSFPLPAKSPPYDNRVEAIKTVCVRLAYSDISEVFIRGCGYIYESVDICEYLEELVDVKGCSYCENNFCNDRPATT